MTTSSSSVSALSVRLALIVLIWCNSFEDSLRRPRPYWARSSLRARTGSVGAVSAIDVEDVTRDEPGFVRRDEHDAIGDLLGEAETTQRNLRRQGRLVLRRAGETGQHAGVGGAGRDGIHANARLGDFKRH